MKKLTLLFVLCLTIASAQAQNLKIGLKAGPSLASLRNHETIKDFTYRLKFHAGLMGNVQLLDIIYLQPEILYSQKGFEYKTGANTIVGKFDYIDVPIMLQAHIDKAYLEFGPQLSFLSSAKLAVDASEGNVDKLLKSTVVGLNAGVGYISNNVLIGLRYSTDGSETFVRLFDKKTKASNSVFQLSFGYFLPF